MAGKCARDGCARSAAPSSSYCHDHKPHWSPERRMESVRRYETESPAYDMAVEAPAQPSPARRTWWALAVVALIIVFVTCLFLVR